MKKLLNFMGSLKLTLILLTIIIIASIVGTLLPQEDANTVIYQSHWFKLVLITLVHNLAICTFRRIKKFRLKNVGFLCVHLGVICLLAGVLVGNTWGTKGRMVVKIGQTTSDFRLQDGSEHSLPFTLTLRKFEVDYHDHGEVLVAMPDQTEPASFPAIVGKKYTLAPSGYTLEILKYIPDFCRNDQTRTIGTRSYKPRNPALHVSVNGKQKMWLFAKHPEMGMHGAHHRKKQLPFKLFYNSAEHVKAYKSHVTVKDADSSPIETVIEVNHPFKYKGYSLYQFSYDQAHYRHTVLQAVSDPGIEIVYAGFLLIIVGIIFVLYLKPVLGKRVRKETEK